MNSDSICVMVVDDSHTIRKTAEKLLEKEGFKVVCVEDGFDALACVADVNTSIIFMDVMMPRLDGYDTCQVIKASAQFTTTPIIMLSSKDGVFDKARGRLAGSEAFITKPFSKDVLIQAITQHLKLV